MAIRNTKVDPQNDLGLGTQSVTKSQRLFNQDGSINVKRKGLPFFSTANNYHGLITMSWPRFWVLVLSGYITINLIFTAIYLVIGIQNLAGSEGVTGMGHFFDAFFFSAQTISTVGYGHIYPHGIAASSVSAIESMIGLLAFALATGLLYGRFSRPSAKISYSKNLLIAPYLENGKAIMFRLANQRRSMLIDLEVEVNFSYNEDVGGKTQRKFIPLELERKRVSLLTLNWTVVHPLNDDSPLKDITSDDILKTEGILTVLLKAFDDTFSQTVHSRTSYAYDEIVWNAKFKPVFGRDKKGRMVLDLSKISDYEKVPAMDNPPQIGKPR